MNQNTTAYTYLERHYHEWTNISVHTYTQEQLHAGDIPATLYKGFNQTKGFVLKDKQQEARKRQWTWCTDVRIKQPPQVRSYVGETAVDWKDVRVKMNKKTQICIPWRSRILPLLPAGPRLKPGINTSPSRVYTCVSDRRGPPNTYRQCHTLLLFHSIVWPETNPSRV